MKVSKRSWHYRLVRWYWKRDTSIVDRYTKELLPMSLCKYSLVLFTSFLSFIALPFAAVFFGIILVAASPIILGGLIYEWWDSRPETPPGLVRSWLAAKKAKVCPMIEWED